MLSLKIKKKNLTVITVKIILVRKLFFFNSSTTNTTMIIGFYKCTL